MMGAFLEAEVTIFRTRRHIFLAGDSSDTPRCRHISAVSPLLLCLPCLTSSWLKMRVFAEWAVGERRRGGGRERKGAQGGVEVVI